MNRLRNRLILVFLAATLVPIVATLWITTTLLERSLSLATTRELDALSKSLEQAGRALYQTTCEKLKAQVAAGRVQPVVYPVTAEAVAAFAASQEKERFQLSGAARDRVDYYVLRGREVLVYSTAITGPGMERLADEYSKARALVERSSTRNLRRGFTYTLIVLAAIVWVVSLVIAILGTRRVSKPMEQLTAGLEQLAAGNLAARLDAKGDDEIGRAMAAFNETAERLQNSRDRLIHVTQLASWQTLARKMAHEVKNSLTPIRLTMEELVARRGERDEKFIEQAAQIVVDEVLTLERRVRAFSQFASEPPVRIAPVDLNGLLKERVALLKNAHPEVLYNVQFADGAKAVADEDLVKGVLTNLLENAAEAAGGGGVVLGRTVVMNGKVAVEVHDSGPGLTQHARSTLFEPTISFKKSGMGLGLSIARKSALMLGGDITLVDGELGGAAFRLLLPGANNGG